MILELFLSCGFQITIHISQSEADAQIVNSSFSASSFIHCSSEILLISKLDLSHLMIDWQPRTSQTVCTASFVTRDNLVSNKMSVRLRLTMSVTTTGTAQISTASNWLSATGNYISTTRNWSQIIGIEYFGHFSTIGSTTCPCWFDDCNHKLVKFVCVSSNIKSGSNKRYKWTWFWMGRLYYSIVPSSEMSGSAC